MESPGIGATPARTPRRGRSHRRGARGARGPHRVLPHGKERPECRQLQRRTLLETGTPRCAEHACCCLRETQRSTAESRCCLWKRPWVQSSHLQPDGTDGRDLWSPAAQLLWGHLTGTRDPPAPRCSDDGSTSGTDTAGRGILGDPQHQHVHPPSAPTPFGHQFAGFLQRQLKSPSRMRERFRARSLHKPS